MAAGFVLGRHTTPTDYHLISEEVLATIDLVKEIDSVQNRELRLSGAVVSPGHIGLHSHQGDPTIVYLLSGVLTNHHNDGTTEEFGPGQVFAEFGPRMHWVENKGAIPVTFIVANISRITAMVTRSTPMKIGNVLLWWRSHVYGLKINRGSRLSSCRRAGRAIALLARGRCRAACSGLIDDIAVIDEPRDNSDRPHLACQRKAEADLSDLNGS